MDDKCLLCGVTVPEGRMLCPYCENDLSEAERNYEQTLAEKIEAASGQHRWQFWLGKNKKEKSQK